MSSVRHHVWGLAFALWVSPARADDDCGATFADCKEDCSLEYGSIRVEMKRRFAKCMTYCEQEAERCTDLKNESRVNSLDEGALEKSPHTPAPKHKSKAKKKRATVEEREPEEPAPARRDSLGEDEAPKSSRTALKTDEKPATTKPATGASEGQEEPLAPLSKPATKGPEAEAAQPEKEKPPLARPKAPPKKEEDDDLRNF